MSWRESPERLRALAAEVDGVADEARELGRDLLAAREEIGWSSVAAEVYQESLADRAADTVAGAVQVDDVAAALRSHAESVAHTLALIDSARSFLLTAAGEARSVLADLWDGLVDLVTPDMTDAQHVLDVAATAPVDDVDLSWIDRAHQVGWRA